MAGEFAGITYGIRDGLALKIASPLYYVWQRGTDGYLFGLTWGVRGRLLRRPRWSAFWEFEVGVSESDTYVPPRGTRFNYLAIGGGGFTIRIRPGVHALGGLRWIHVSNNSLAGRDRNPDIEAIGPDHRGVVRVLALDSRGSHFRIGSCFQTRMGAFDGQ